MTATTYLNTLNHNYLTVHRKKEDLFWDTYMGISGDHEQAAKAQSDWIHFLADPNKISEIKSQIKEAESLSNPLERKTTITGLNGWLVMFESHAIESQKGQQLKTELINFEAALFEKKQNHTMTYRDGNGHLTDASLPVLSSLIRTSDNETVRKSAHSALLELEQWLLQNGFIELIKLRNKFAHALGYDSFFDYSVVKTEQMSAKELFVILDDFEQQTRQNHLKSLADLSNKKGKPALTGHNFAFSYSGGAMRELDSYVPFSKSLRHWVDSFGRLNINYSEAELTLDLLDRKGKYQNGFCHGPVPAFYDQNLWVPAKVNFTSNAKPDQMGSGYDGINTLFHEGGHAAHFANVKMNAPCFSQEFAPTSMAYAETQSMFCDSLLTDADWLKQYAINASGDAVPDDIIKKMVYCRQPFKAYGERSILVVPYFERALYQLTDDELTPENITNLARNMEKNILGLECSPRPLLAIPHLLSDESACSYQGYLLAHMAVYQTRAYFTEKFGYLTDNPEIGPLLAKHYWNKGNHISHSQTIESLTGEKFCAKHLADACNLSAEDAWLYEQKKIVSLNTRTRAKISPLNATIKIVDGQSTICDNTLSDEEMCRQFECYVNEKYGC